MEEIHIYPEQAVEEIRQILTGPDESKLDRALLLTEALLHMDRDNHGLCFCMGVGYMRQGRVALAEHWYKRALTLQPDFAEAINNLGFCAQKEGDIKGAIKLFDQALEMSPDMPEFINNAATAFVNNGTPDRAIELCDKVLALDPTHKDARWNKSLALLEKGDWAAGWDLYACGLEKNVASSASRKVRHYIEEDKTPYWDGTKGQYVAVYGEQGVGDEIMAASMLEDFAKDCEFVVYECHPRLLNIFRHSFSHLENVVFYGTRKQDWWTLEWPTWQRVDAKMPVLQLGQFYRRSAESFPKKAYLHAFSDHYETMLQRLRDLGDRPRIGISWKGGSGATRFDLRSLSLPAFVPLMKSVDATWVSLQYDPADRPGHNAAIVEKVNREAEVNLHHWPEIINDLDIGYGGLVPALDLVISVNASLVHACGAYGIDCWTLTPSRPAWRYGLVDEEMPWYGSWVKQYRQQEDDWQSVMDRVIKDLSDRVKRSKAA